MDLDTPGFVPKLTSEHDNIIVVRRALRTLLEHADVACRSAMTRGSDIART